MDSKKKAKLNALIAKHVKAQIALSWAGSEEPEDAEITKGRATLAQNRLRYFIETTLSE